VSSMVTQHLKPAAGCDVATRLASDAARRPSDDSLLATRCSLLAACSFLFAVCFSLFIGPARAAQDSAKLPPVELELATEKGFPITGAQEWTEALAKIGLARVRIHAARGGEKPSVERRGSRERPRFYVVGILTSHDKLKLPGGAFSRNETARLKAYLATLQNDGVEGVTAERAAFGLTPSQWKTIRGVLEHKIDFDTKGSKPADAVRRMTAALDVPSVVDARADTVLASGKPVLDEVKGLTAGTAMAVVLRQYGLVLRPQKRTGRPVELLIAPAAAGELAWPIGWQAEKKPAELVPALFKFVNVEIEGYTLREALSAIEPRVDIPFLTDHQALVRKGIDPGKVKASMPAGRTYYHKIVRHILFQARLSGELRVDEAGRPFLWITVLSGK